MGRGDDLVENIQFDDTIGVEGASKIVVDGAVGVH